MTTPRVLFLQDDEALRRRLGALLEAAGFAVEPAGSGPDAPARAQGARPDLVLVDVHLPDADGPALAVRLRQERGLAGVPIVAMGASEEERAAALAAGADAFVLRADDGALAARLREVLGGARERLPAERELEALRALVGGLARRAEAAAAGQRRAGERLVEAEQLKSAFMHNLSHELSTPLTPLAGYLRILQGEKLGALVPQQKRIVDAMMQAVARLTRILDNLSDFASLQAGQAPLVVAAMQPDQLADAVAAEQRSPAKDARLHLVVQHAGGPAVLADARKLHQALSNLLANAVKFSPRGGEVLLEVGNEGGRLRYAVYDQGPGIRPEEQERIFEPMHHAAARRGLEARPPGSGLGLPVARRIADTHGGRIWVESPPRTQPLGVPHQFTGSKFVLEVPVRPAGQAGPAAGEGSPAAVTG